MSHNKFHKTWIENELVPGLIENQKLIILKSASEYVELASIEVDEMSHTIAFMMTFCYNVKIVVKHHNLDDEKAEEQVFYLVVKMTPELDESSLHIMNFPYLFANEITAYEYILPKLRWLSYFPKYYYSHNRASGAAIALSDFTRDGWTMSSSRINLSIDHIIISVRELGRFHGKMYALKHIDAETFENIKSKLVESRYHIHGTEQEWMFRLDLGIKRATKCVREVDDSRNIVPEEFLKQLENVLKNTYHYQRKCVQPIEPMAVICHGDYLRNNIAYRYDADGKATNAMMFDFQTLRYASPMVDLNTFMANSTGRIEREQYFWNIFSAYHDTMVKQYSKTTELNESIVPEFLKYDNFLEEYVRFLPFGLSIAGSFLHSLHAPRPFYGQSNHAKTTEEIVRDSYEQGGEAVDSELRALVVEMIQLHQKLGITLNKI